MKAVRLFEIDKPPRLVEVPEPKIDSPTDVIVRIAGAGVCRTDLHLVEGVFEAVKTKLPFTLGHENAGWAPMKRSTRRSTAAWRPSVMRLREPAPTSCSTSSASMAHPTTL